MNHSDPIETDVVLVGGGHSHALLLRRWAMNPLPGVRLTLISKDVLTPYSGMLPGYVAGRFSFEEIHIDLLRLCEWAKVRFIKAELTGIDLDRKRLEISDRPPVSYDLLSLDTGSTPSLAVPGAAEHSTPVKPVYSFIERWNQLHQREPKNLGVVGAGAGGYELVMAMAHRLKDSATTLHWFLRGDLPMKDRPTKLSSMALEHAKAAGIQVHLGFDVREVKPKAVLAADGREQAFEDLLWCAAAHGPEWPEASGLRVDERGFVATTDTLQSVSHPEVFATGDIGTQINTPSAKAGVFAVRQAPVLFHNLRAILRDRPLKTYVPQKDFLSLLATNDHHAIGNRGGITISGDWVWRLKYRIDNAFMNKFVELPQIQMDTKPSSTPESMRCNGCGAKVPGDVLQEVLAELPLASPAIDVQSGVTEGDDAAVVSWTSNQLIQSVDQLRALIADPYLFGKIASVHALSDVHAQGAKAHSAQVLITLPYSKPTIVRRDLEQLMLGIVEILNQESCALIGGHTAEGSELQVGLVVNAEPSTVDSSQVLNSRPVEEMSMVLTQPLGIGVLFAGLMQSKAKGVDVDSALRYLTQSNRVAADILARFGSIHCTDVTGFGLLGHLHRLAIREKLSCDLRVNQVPMLVGVEALISEGVKSSLSDANQAVLDHVVRQIDLSLAHRILLTDPQTSGGLLALVPSDQAIKCIADLRDAGYESATVIGSAKNSVDTIETAAISLVS